MRAAQPRLIDDVRGSCIRLLVGGGSPTSRSMRDPRTTSTKRGCAALTLLPLGLGAKRRLHPPCRVSDECFSLFFKRLSNYMRISHLSESERCEILLVIGHGALCVSVYVLFLCAFFPAARRPKLKTGVFIEAKRTSRKNRVGSPPPRAPFKNVKGRDGGVCAPPLLGFSLYGACFLLCFDH